MSIFISLTALPFFLSLGVGVEMWVSVIKRKRHKVLGAVEDPDGLGPSVRPSLPIDVGYKATQGNHWLSLLRVSRNN